MASRQPTVLIVDDRPENLLALETVIETLDVEILRATSGNEALSQTLDNDIALVLMDIRMPDMDGFETAELMRGYEKTRHVPIIFVTGASEDMSQVFKGYETGAVDFIIKPFEPLILLSKIKVFLQLYKQQRALEESEERYRIITELSSDFVYWRDETGALLYVSPASRELTGYDANEFMDTPDLLDQIVCDEDKHLWQDHGRDVSVHEKAESLELRICRRDGEMRWLNHMCRPVFGKANQYRGIRASNRDITERKALEEELRRLTRRDGLTGIANRRYFDEELDLEWRRAMRQINPISLIMLDVDNFKAYNDEYGHQAGDTCLKSIAETIAKASKRAREMVARYGGEEFAVVLPDMSGTQAWEVAEGIRQDIIALNIPHSGGVFENKVTVSLGIAAMVPPRDAPPATLVSAADAALYRAKSEGRNRTVGAGHADAIR